MTEWDDGGIDDALDRVDAEQRAKAYWSEAETEAKAKALNIASYHKPERCGGSGRIPDGAAFGWGHTLKCPGCPDCT